MRSSLREVIENIYLTLTVRLTYHSMRFLFDYLSKMQGRVCKIKMLWLNLSRTLVLKNDLGFVEDRNQFHVGPGRRLVEFLLNMDPSVSVLAFICQNNDPAPWLMKSLSVFPSLRCLIKSRLVSCSFVWNASFNINFCMIVKDDSKDFSWMLYFLALGKQDCLCPRPNIHTCQTYLSYTS